MIEAPLLCSSHILPSSGGQKRFAERKKAGFRRTAKHSALIRVSPVPGAISERPRPIRGFHAPL